jgi:diacylglycerol kinase family enzyme
VRALLIVNPHATSTTQVRRNVIERALSSELDLKVVQTRYRGHAFHVAEAAAQAGYGLVLTLGGDGTVNEAVNGLLRTNPPGGLQDTPATDSRLQDPPPAGWVPAGPLGPDPATAPVGPVPVGPVPVGPVPVGPVPVGPVPVGPVPVGPALATLPGGNANVFPQALGMPADPVDATGRVLAALTSGSVRIIGVGLADDRYFCFNAGLGIDAEVVRAVEGLRASGRSASTQLYVWAAMRQFYGVTNRRDPALTLERAGEPPMDGLFCGIVSNTAPWTYLGRRPVQASPQAGFDTGLDLFAMRSLGSVGTFRAVRQMIWGDRRPPHGKHIVSLHDEPGFTLRASRPMAFQVDGEYVGERDTVTFHSIPNALRVII